MNDKTSHMPITPRIEMDQQFGGNCSHSILWNKIHKELEAAGHDCSTSQIHNSWKNIKRKFMSVVDHNRLTGADPKSCTFCNELSEVFGTKRIHLPSGIPRYQRDSHGLVSSSGRAGADCCLRMR